VALFVKVGELDAVGEGDTLPVGEEDPVAVPVSVDEMVAVPEAVGDSDEVADDVTEGDSELEGDTLDDEAVNTDGHAFALCALIKYLHVAISRKVMFDRPGPDDELHITSRATVRRVGILGLNASGGHGYGSSGISAAGG
jgi:hypothetical protein